MGNRGEEWPRNLVLLLCGPHEKEQNTIQIKLYFKVPVLSTVSGEKTQCNADQAHSKAMSRSTVPAQHQDTKLLNSCSALHCICVAILYWEDNQNSLYGSVLCRHNCLLGVSLGVGGMALY